VTGVSVLHPMRNMPSTNKTSDRSVSATPNEKHALNK
jgi:hypothetical protein